MVGDITNYENMGALNLKIAQLERHLRILEQQQLLSSSYPDYRAKLAQRISQLQLQLDQLHQHRSVVL